MTNTISMGSGKSNVRTRKLLTPVKFMLYVAALVFIGTLWSWWHYIYNNENRIFWGMVGNNMRTTSFTRSSTQDNGTQQVTQATAVQTSGDQLVNGTVHVEQPAARIQTESIGTPYVDYVRYTSIDVLQTPATGTKPDVSNVVNVWGKSDSDGTSTSGQLYNEAVIGFVLYGNLPAATRAALVKELRDTQAYVPMLVGTSKSGLRTTYTYDVKVNLAAFAGVLKKFAHESGLTQYDTIDPAQYNSSPAQTLTMKVDGMSRQLTEISYNDSERVESISSYGSVKALASSPKEAIPFEELQYRLQSLQ